MLRGIASAANDRASPCAYRTQTADWTKTTGSMVDELIIEDGKGAHVSPMHDIPTFPRSRVLERRFPTMWHGGRRPMVVQATVVGQRK